MTALWFLLGALAISAIGSAIVVLRHRNPTTEDWSVEEFRREMHALSPEATRVRRNGPGPVQPPKPASPSTVRRSPAHAPRRGPQIASPTPTTAGAEPAAEPEDQGT
jgi:hypothetical protein